jgi:LPS sulfotransferase NodH
MGNLSARTRLLLWLAKLLGRTYPKQDDQPQPFVLLSKQRSGSTWLMDLLDSHPQIDVFAELFNASGYGTPRVGRNRDILYWNSYAALHPARTRMEKLRLYFQYLDEEVFRKRPGKKAIGFKLMYNQAATELGLLAYLSVRGVAVIHLIRRNHLDAILSEETSLVRGVAHAESGAEVADLRIELDTLTLLDRLEQREADVQGASEFLASENVPCREVHYEDLLASPTALKPIQGFLDVGESSSLTSNLTKINPTSHRQLIRNYDAVQEALTGTRFAGLLR